MPGSEYYDHTTYPSTGASGSSAALRAELDLIETGFGKLPDLSGNGGKVVAVNSGATALEALTTTGTGNGVRATSPTLTSPTMTTPTLGVASATSINKVAVTAPATGATLTLAEGSTLATVGAYSVTFTATAATALTLPTTGTLATLAGSETLTNKTIDAASNTFVGVITATSTTTLTNKTIDKASNTLTGVAGSGANSDITSLTGLTTPLTQAQGGTGTALSTRQLAQIQATQTSAVATGVTQMPIDDTIPQNTEGDQYLSQTITPKSATSTLEIEVVLNISHSVSAVFFGAALFQDSTAGALAACFGATAGGANGPVGPLVLKHTMTSGTTSATTFKVRAGTNTAGTTTFNGHSSGRIFGGVIASSITIKEYLP